MSAKRNGVVPAKGLQILNMEMNLTAADIDCPAAERIRHAGAAGSIEISELTSDLLGQ